MHINLGTNKFLLSALCAVIFGGTNLNAFFGKSFFNLRSPAINMARDMVGVQRFTHRFDMDEMYAVYDFTIGYARTTNPCNIAQQLFGTSELIFSGSQVPNRAITDILADNFGVASDFRSKVIFTPVIQNTVINFSAYFGLDEISEGLYFIVRAPFVVSSWDLGFKEDILSPGTLAYPAGYMAPLAVSTSELAASMCEAFKGKTTFGDQKSPLMFGKIDGKQTYVKFAEIQLILGRDYLSTERSHLGFNIRLGAPAGNTSTSEFLFEPIVGNGKHWTLGLGFSSHFLLWLSADEEHFGGIYWDGYAEHLFTRQHIRSFDFKPNGPGSRYMLMTEIGQPVNNLNLGAVIPGSPAANQYQRSMIPAINKSTLAAQIRILGQLETAIKFGLQSRGFSFELGYNLWGRTKESLKSRCAFESNKYGMKGDAQLYGFSDSTPVALNVSQSSATINAGQGAGNADYANSNADNPVTARNSAGNGLQILPPTNTNPINGSNLPVLLNDRDIDECSVLTPAALTHKLFTHLSYAWLNQEDWLPFIGVGAEYEWASSWLGCNAGQTQWGIWVKLGTAF